MKKPNGKSPAARRREAKRVQVRRRKVERRRGATASRDAVTPSLWRAGEQPAPVLPRLGSTGGDLVVDGHGQPPGSGGWGPRGRAGRGASTGRAAAGAVGALKRGARTYWWQLLPAGATVAATAGAAVDPRAAMLALTALGGAGLVSAAKGPERIAGRAWLSTRERNIAGHWGGGAALWAGGFGTGLWHLNLAGVAALAALTGAQTWAWMGSRKPHRKPKARLSEQTRALVSAWPFTVAVNGPDPLIGSGVIPSSVSEPHPGTIALSVQLRDGIHSGAALGQDVTNWFERALSMGVGTASTEAVRDDAGRLRIVLTPSRHLEKTTATWDGLELLPDGRIPLAVTREGKDAHVALYNEDGVEHAGIFGTTGGGKSNTLVAMVVPGVRAGREVLWYADGGDGTSAGFLAGACDWWAVGDVQVRCDMIAAAHAVMRARKKTRAAAGLSSWRGLAEPYLVLTLIFDEATTILRELPPAFAAMVFEMLREGRKLGVRVIQSTQDPMGTDLIGGRQARDLMAGGGSLIGHRPGGSTANTLTGTSTATAVDLRELPGEPGWCAVIRRGQVVARAARVRYASPDEVKAILAGTTPPTLTGDEATTAGAAYRDRLTGTAAAAGQEAAKAAMDGTPSPSPVGDLSVGTDEPAPDAPPIVETDPRAEQAIRSGALIDDSGPTVAAAEVEPAPGPAGSGGTVSPLFPELQPALTGAAAATAHQAEMTVAAVRGELAAAGSAGLTRAELARRTGAAERSIGRALTRLDKDGAAVQDPVSRAWSLRKVRDAA
ncbi:MAG: hypothetical protein ACRCYX_12525 [Dermatophilaceae bacterium]